MLTYQIHIGLTVGVTCQQRMLTPPRHLTPHTWYLQRSVQSRFLLWIVPFTWCRYWFWLLIFRLLDWTYWFWLLIFRLLDWTYWFWLRIVPFTWLDILILTVDIPFTWLDVLILTVDIPFTWLDILILTVDIPFTWLDILILTADCSVYLNGHSDFDCELFRFPDLDTPIFAIEMEHTTGITGRQGMVAPPRHLILPLGFVWGSLSAQSSSVFHTVFMRLITVCYITLTFGWKKDDSLVS
jgi:hypothetical protein